MPSRPHELAIDHVRDLLSRGFFLSAHDAAMAAIASGEDTPTMRHAAILALARAGARSSALRLLDQWGLRASPDPELAGLYPRLLKDVALETLSRQDALAAAHAYQTLWQGHDNSWHGVNAAAMHLLAGDRATATDIARKLAADPDQGDYWSAATRAEAALLLGDEAQCCAWLQIANGRAGADLSCRATTRRQLRWEAALLGQNPALVDALEIPATIHYCGLIPDEPDDETAVRDALHGQLAGVGYAFGSLAAGGDILIAEAALARGVTLTVLLPYPAADFVERSVRPAGKAWVLRFERCLARADVRVLGEAPQDDLDFSLVSRRAMGLARLHATRLDGAVWQLALWDGRGEAGALAGTAADVATWRRAGGETRVLPAPWSRKPHGTAAFPPPATPARSTGAVLFGDLPRFSTLDDRALAAFYAGPMRAMGEVVDAALPRFRNAWGDAIQLVFDSPAEAARCAVALRDTLAAPTPHHPGFAGDLAPRLALDFGGLHPVFDAIQGVAKFAGRAMMRAARIEPVTPPGMIYATEAFACEIALFSECKITCDYSGLVPTAKGFGILSLYACNRRTS